MLSHHHPPPRLTEMDKRPTAMSMKTTARNAPEAWRVRWSSSSMILLMVLSMCSCKRPLAALSSGRRPRSSRSCLTISLVTGRLRRA